MVSSAAAPAAGFAGVLAIWPRAPQTMAETGLLPAFLEELALKTFHYGGSSTLGQLSRRMGLSAAVAGEIVERLRAGGALESAAAEVDGGQGSSGAVRHALSGRGEQRAADALARCRYGGVAPITLAQYEPLARLQSLRRRPPDAAQIDRALAPFVLSDDVRQALGRAFHSGRPALLYGESGNGKTAIIDSFTRRLGETVLIPAALYVQGQLIRVFDPSLHRRVEQVAVDAASPGVPPPLFQSDTELLDRRWLPVRRPVVAVAGELTLESLEFRFDELGGFYVAPLQLKAQDGVFVVDDFGRHQVRPDDLLNRWMLPLERGSDLLTLQNGDCVTLPFEVSVIFSTNLPPGLLADDALLRRMPYKVHVSGPGPQEFAEIARRECTRRRLAWDDAGVAALVNAVMREGRPSPRGVVARDLLGIIDDGARFAGRPAGLTAASVEEACRVYFVTEPA